MSSTTPKVFLYCKLPSKPAKDNKLFLCYEDSCPIPWEQDIFFVKDEKDRNWFCYEVRNMPLDEPALNSIAQTIKREHLPKNKTKEGLSRQYPLVLQVGLCRVKELDELRGYLGEFKFREN